MKKNFGFTLVELLVVISVIGILASIVLVSFTGSQKQARDTQRKSDLKQYQLALENFANKSNGLYPVESLTVSADDTVSGLCGDLTLTGCPSDPRKLRDPSFDYKYQSDGTLTDGSAAATKYVLWGKIENVTSTTYWVLCSNGKTGQLTSGIPPSGGTCPL